MDSSPPRAERFLQDLPVPDVALRSPIRRFSRIFRNRLAWMTEAVTFENVAAHGPPDLVRFALRT
jgi:hypothetical protein